MGQKAKIENNRRLSANAPRGQERLREVAKLGFTHAIVPKANKPKQKIEGVTIFAVERVEEAVEYCRAG